MVYVSDAKSLNGSMFGKPRRPVHLNNVYCTGLEQQLIQCSSFRLLLRNGRDILEEVDVASVRCHKPNLSMNTTAVMLKPSSIVNPSQQLQIGVTHIFIIIVVIVGALALVGVCMIIG